MQIHVFQANLGRIWRRSARLWFTIKEELLFWFQKENYPFLQENSLKKARQKSNFQIDLPEIFTTIIPVLSYVFHCIFCFFLFFFWNCNYTSVTATFLREVMDFEAEPSQKHTTAWLHLSVQWLLLVVEIPLPHIKLFILNTGSEMLRLLITEEPLSISKKLNISIQFWR